MNKLICFDLMETLIFPPKKEFIQVWLSEQNYELTVFQKELYVNGFPYAAFIKNKEEFKEIRDVLLCTPIENTRDVCKLLSIAYDSKKAQLTDAYISMFLSNFRFQEEILKILLSWNEQTDLKLVSNLYSAFKPLLTYTKLNMCFKNIILSCDSLDKKPNITMFQKTDYQKYDIKIFIGDNWISDIVTPLKLGFDCYFINTWDQFIHTISKKGVAFLLEKKIHYRIKDKYKHIASLYLDPLLTIEHITSDDLELMHDKLQFQFMKNIKVVDDINQIDLLKGASNENI